METLTKQVRFFIAYYIIKPVVKLVLVKKYTYLNASEKKVMLMYMGIEL